MQRPFRAFDPEDPAGGGPAPVEAEAPIEQEAPPLPDFNDAFVSAEIDRRAAEQAVTQFNAYKAELARQATQYQQPINPQPQLQKSPQQLKQDKINAVLSAGDNWEQQIAAIVDLMETSNQDGQAAVRRELAPLIQHSATQSATNQVLRHVPNVPPEARAYIEQAVEEMGFQPQDLAIPKNAQFVADAAETRARRAGVLGQQAPVQQVSDQTRAGTLFNQPRTPVAVAAPVSVPTAKTWRESASREEQTEIDKMFSQYTPKGMKVEDVFSAEDITQALRDVKAQAMFKGMS